MSSGPTVTRVGQGMYLVEHDGRRDVMYVAGPASDRWVFWNGSVFHGEIGPGASRSETAAPVHAPATSISTSITAPMPARVGSLNAAPGSRVAKGDILIVLEAMKMELPIRAPGDARVTAVHCQTGELVQADALLIELE